MGTIYDDKKVYNKFYAPMNIEKTALESMFKNLQLVKNRGHISQKWTAIKARGHDNYQKALQLLRIKGNREYGTEVGF